MQDQASNEQLPSGNASMRSAFRFKPVSASPV